MTEELKKLLQECDTLKARLVALRPLPAEALKKIDEALAVEYTYESNRIEGNTLTLQETELVVNEGVTIAGKSMREHLEAINHREAIDYIKDFAKNDIEISEGTIKEIHALVLHGINRENAGRYRTVPVMISGSQHIPPQPYLIEEQMEEFMFLGLRMMEGVSERMFFENFGRRFEEVFPGVIEKHEKLGLLEVTGEEFVHLKLTSHGIDVSNQVFVDFML